MLHKLLTLSCICFLVFIATASSQGQPSANPALDFMQLQNLYRSQSDQCWDLMNEQWTAWPAAPIQGPTGFTAEPGFRALVFSSALADAAESHNQNMISTRCNAHVCQNEEDPNLTEGKIIRKRIEAAGYPQDAIIGENLAWPPVADPQVAFEQWRKSIGNPAENTAGHNGNMLGCFWKAAGVSYTPGNDQSQWPHYWTVDFGSIDDSLTYIPPPAGQTCFQLPLRPGETISDETMLELIRNWILGVPLC